jgi:uncharacterized membrane protein
MVWLLLGLFVFVGVHSLRVVAPAWRDERVAQWGAGKWKVAISLLSIAGFVLMIWGYSQARQAPILLWTPPAGMRHAAALLTLPAFVLLVAAYVPRNVFKTRLGHPMVVAVKLWALAHLLANGWLHAVVLFGSLLLWSILSFRAARRRDPPSRAPSSALATSIAVAVGSAAWAGFAFYLHGRWIGVAPFQ